MCPGDNCYLPKNTEQAEAEVVPSSSSVKAKLSLVKLLLLEIKSSFPSDF